MNSLLRESLNSLIFVGVLLLLVIWLLTIGCCLRHNNICTNLSIWLSVIGLVWLSVSLTITGLSISHCSWLGILGAISTIAISLHSVSGHPITGRSCHCVTHLSTNHHHWHLICNHRHCNCLHLRIHLLFLHWVLSELIDNWSTRNSLHLLFYLISLLLTDIWRH